MPLDDIIRAVEQSVLLVGQAYNALSYHRKNNILTAITSCPRKAKNILKEKRKILQKEKVNLFGQTFETHLIKTNK